MTRMAQRNEMLSTLLRYRRLGLDKKENDPFVALARIRGCCRREEDALALLAMYETLRHLRLMGDTEILSAVRAVYFPLCRRRRLTKNELSSSVLRHAMAVHCDERTVYRRLGAFRKLYEAHLHHL